ncbi:hypothetical protein SARC_01237 [Sphaeroforma arctica JP610]|uniref:Uncharacterized protein n=1 Tax=Sphaeroforma arctica JP610 TaxID=667725 RepID=A0A0L0GEE5_9EUKA|nr:hypothetical protein SARC_01237 [Sphaeroforma arctica JP610]KNC86608.1 hypothetical protein SARC_01237 [Sphaeroforma arctica JP610]|eukprot:XP_014160510.1 hypothetical protein SARC_01237 [Sphaeroforma arctica JP610]
MLMHLKGAKEKSRLIQEQLRQLCQLSLADIDMYMPQDTAQAKVNDEFSATEVKSVPQYPTQAELPPTDQSPDIGAIKRKKISQVKRRIGRTKPVPQVAPYENVHVTRRERLLKNAQNRAQTIPTPDEMPADGLDWYQESTTLVKSPEERKENCQDNANVPIDTLAYFPVHHDRYLEDPQDVKRCKISPPTEACITESTAAEMKTQVFLLTQRMMQAEAEGLTEDIRSLQGLIRTSNETLKTCSKTVEKRTSKKWPPNPQGSYYLDNPQKKQFHAFILDWHKNVKFRKLDPTHMPMGLHRALQKERAPKALLDFIVENELKLHSMSFLDATAYIVRTHEQDMEDNTQLRDFERKVNFMKMRQYENPLHVYRNHGMLNLINQAVRGAYHRDTLRMHPNRREYSAAQMRDVFRVSIDKAEEHRRASLPDHCKSPGANTRANPHAPPASNPKARCRSCEQNLPPGPVHAPRCLKLLRAPNGNEHGQPYATWGCATIPFIGWGNIHAHTTSDEVGESEVMNIHDLVDESYVDSEDELMEAAQGPADREDEPSSN